MSMRRESETIEQAERMETLPMWTGHVQRISTQADEGYEECQ
jgi:hypothetical protein